MPRFLAAPPQTRQQQNAAAAASKTPEEKPVEISIPAPAEGQELTVSVRRVGSGSLVSTTVQDKDWIKPPVRTEEIINGAAKVTVKKIDSGTPK